MIKSIMIVDDNEIIRNKVRDLFIRAKEDWIICAEAVSGKDAVAKAQQFHPDFVVLDFCMPVMDGLEAAPKLKAIVPHASIVMLTAFKAYRAGVSWVLSKEEPRKVIEFARILLRSNSPTHHA